MWPRIAVGTIAATAVIGIFLAVTRSASPQPLSTPARPANAQAVPPRAPLLSSAFYFATKDVFEIEPAAALRLERQLAAQPADSDTRAKLMAYWRRPDQVVQEGNEAKRWREALWLIEYEPDSEILHSYVAQFSPGQRTPAEIRSSVELWETSVRAKAGDVARLWNAACFFRELEPGLHLSYLEATAEADPNHPDAVRQLAQSYAGALLEQTSPLAIRARLGLERSKNVWVLGNAAHLLQSYYNQTVTMRAPDRRLEELAERYFARALTIDPALDRLKILPRFDPGPSQSEREAEAAKNRALFAAAERQIRRLPVDAFPQLPATIARVLRARKCTVPQSSDTAAENVIRGEFIVPGERGWALLCSVNESSTLLIFRNDADEAPQALAAARDSNYLQGLGGEKVGFSRGIGAVDRAYIVSHYRAYGGPTPPPIDHQGIADAFLEKASTVWYFHAGKWLQLQGAD